MKLAMRCVIGVDLGGTNVRAQAVWEDGTPAGDRIEQRSRAQEGTEPVIEALTDAIGRAVGSAEQKPESVGLAIPGHIDNQTGIVRWAPNFGIEIDDVFHYWENVPIREPLVARIGLPVLMANDANAAALGEYQFGSGRGTASCLVMLTLGTGIGGGVVLSPRSVNGEAGGPLVLLGGNMGGAEMGHTLLAMDGIDSTAGAYGTLEAYCQRDGIVRRTQHRLKRGRTSVIRDMVAGDLGKVTPRVISAAAEQGDDLAREIWAEFGRFLGNGVGNLINIFAPDVFALGGQIARAHEWFMPSLVQAARDFAIPSLFRDCAISLAERDEDAGILGGAAIALQSTAN